MRQVAFGKGSKRKTGWIFRAGHPLEQNLTEASFGGPSFLLSLYVQNRAYTYWEEIYEYADISECPPPQM